MNPVELLNALGHDNPTPEYTPTGDQRVPIGDWGKDHWSTLAYLETRIVDHRGRIGHEHMRCHSNRHPLMVSAKKRAFGSIDGSAYPTRLSGGRELVSHDDYDCIDDMITAGLVTVTMPPAPAGAFVTGLVEAELMTRATYHLTEAGQRVTGQLRAHKGAGNNYATFRPDLETTP